MGISCAQTMQIHVLTIFPCLFESFFSTSLLGKAAEKGILHFGATDIRKFAEGPHNHVDDYPYGGGPGLVMKPEPLVAAIEDTKQLLPSARTILLSPSGAPFSQRGAKRLAKEEALILVCGRYEGIDQRVIDLAIDEEISIGDFVLMGGEVAAMAVIEAVCRLRPEVIGNAESAESESFSERSDGLTLLEWPQYTRPEVFRGMEVPEILKCGDHAKIHAWRVHQALEKTIKVRSDLISRIRAQNPLIREEE